MFTASYRSTTTEDRSSPRRRLAALLLAILIEALLLLAIVALNSRPTDGRAPQGEMATFDVSADTPAATEDSADKPAADRTVKTTPIAPMLPPAPPQPDKPLPMIIVTKDVYAASDISKLGRPKKGADSGEQQASASMPGDSPTVGTAPNGEPLYAAEWYREPTNQELAFYLPKRMPEGGGWGMVACKTVARYKVDQCVDIGSGPAGAGLGRAVRDASWQFLVRPPRVGGKVMVGEWVRIRIDYIRDGKPEL
ncbi:MAG: hypothetical protein ABI667_06005 [Sphingomicrobium sp.]